MTVDVFVPWRGPIGPAGLIAVVLAALAAGLLVWAPARGAGPSRARTARWWLAGPGVVVVVIPAGWLVPALVLAVAALAAWRLWCRRRERRDREATGRRVLDVCEQLAGDLAAGQPPGAALAHAATVWPALAAVAEAFRIGSDVPSALRAVAGRAGAGDLRLLAASWQVSHRTGQGLAEAVDRIAGELVEARATRRLVDGELASARATARLIAVLPVAALAMGSGVGGSPVGYLLTTPAGWACLAGGLAAELAGLWWIESIARDIDRPVAA